MGERELIKKMQADLNQLRKENARLKNEVAGERKLADAVREDARNTEEELRAVILLILGKYVDNYTAVIPKEEFNEAKWRIKRNQQDFFTGENYGGDYLVYLPSREKKVFDGSADRERYHDSI